MKNQTKTYEVNYDKKVGGVGTVVVRAKSDKEAIRNAKFLVYTGSNFRNPVVVHGECYTKPRKQGFQGRH